MDDYFLLLDYVSGLAYLQIVDCSMISPMVTSAKQSASSGEGLGETHITKR